MIKALFRVEYFIQSSSTIQIIASDHPEFGVDDLFDADDFFRLTAVYHEIEFVDVTG